jgi:hypothetical protein
VLSGAFALLALIALTGRSAAAQSGSTTATTITGSVYDSLSGTPLDGALVQLIGTDGTSGAWNATTYANGEFAFPAVPSGKYLMGFLHPALDSLGLGAPRRIVDATAGSPVRVALAIPSATSIWTMLCAGPAADAADSTGLLFGFIRDADSGAPLSGATAVVMWSALVVDGGVRIDRQEVPVKANEEGWYALCGVPTGTPVTARAELGKDVSGYVAVSVPKRAFLHRDFSIPRGSAAVAVSDTARGPGLRRGSARLAGVVLDADGRPLAGAQLMVWGSGVTVTTHDGGTFSLASLPAGTQTLEARYIGYAPKRVTVDLKSNQTRSVTVKFDEPADVLSEVTVLGESNKRLHDVAGFLDRRKSSNGYFLTHDEIVKRHPYQFTDLLRTFPGFVVRGDGVNSSIFAMGRGGMTSPCRPQLYLDGVPLFYDRDINFVIQPSQILGVEAYVRPNDTPPQFTNGECGSIVIWTGPDIASSKDQ